MYGSNGGIFRRVVEWTWERLLVVSGGPRLTIEGSAGNDFLSINRQSWICRASIDRLLCVIYRLVFTALTWSGVSCEAKHVRQVFAKLSSTGQTSLSNTSHCRGRGWTLISSGVASLDNVILAVVEALSSILGKYRRMWSRCCRDEAGVWDARQMTSLCRAQRRLFCWVQADSWCTMITWLLLRATTTHEPRVDHCNRIATTGGSSRGWSYTVGLWLSS